MEDEYYETPEEELARYKQMEHQAALRKRAKDRELDKQLDQQEEAVKFQAEAQAQWEQELKNVGLTQQQYNDLINKNPDMIKQAVMEGQRQLAQKAARLRDPRTGRYLPNQPAPQAQPQTGLPNLGQYQPPRVKQTGEKTAQTKERVYRGESVSDDDVLDALDDILGG